MSDLQDIFLEPQKIKIGDKTYKLEYNYYAYALLEREIGVSRGEIIKKIEQGQLFASDEIALLWAGLHKHQPEIEIETIKNISDTYQISTQLNSIIEAFLAPMIPPKSVNEVSIEKKTL